MRIDDLDRAGPYDVVYADPPWLYYGDPNKDQAAGKHYACMSPEQIRSLPVAGLLAKPAVVLIWATSAKMKEAVDLFPAWGAHYRGVFQVWVKTTNAGNIIHGQGVRPSFIKPTAEFLLIGATTPKGRPLPLASEKMPNVVLAPRPGGIHSRKPESFRQTIVDLFGEKRRLEMFAREAHTGWDIFGSEAPSCG